MPSIRTEIFDVDSIADLENRINFFWVKHPTAKLEGSFYNVTYPEGVIGPGKRERHIYSIHYRED